MATSDSLDGSRRRTMELLIKHVGRAFYDPKYIIVLDQLARHEVLKDDDLAGRVGLSAKDLGKVVGKLVADGLVLVQRQNQNRTGETNGRVTSKGYYYIDYGNFCNVVKWRIAEMRRLIDNNLRNELAQQGYVCPQCHKTFQTLDVMHLSRGNGLYCDQCDGELVDNMHHVNASGKEDRMQRFNAQTQWIRDGLRKTEDMTMPKLDINEWIKRHPPVVPQPDGDSTVDDGLAIAGSHSGAAPQQKYEVIFTDDDTTEMERIQREKEAAAKKKQNALPAWHTRSTITGDITAFGLKNMAHSESSEPTDSTGDAKPFLNDGEDLKNSINMYYANLEAESVDSTPAEMELDYPGSGYDDRRNGLAVPSLSTLSSSASYKRKRGESDAFTSGENESLPSPKHSRNNSYQSTPLRSKSRDSAVSSSGHSGQSSQNGINANGDMGQENTNHNSYMPNPKDPLVLVNSVGVPLSQITNEHHELMTPEEYEEYYRILGEVQ
ncbi:hypothetical protein FRC03_011323 [Tulasnella sp. 419]|nr:hypothetical protein FRC02_011410 [Tulasnella sp. 418]KAG8966800.1 hypothetical protein FRC03_011323 [Tulasnella sp. 419]